MKEDGGMIASGECCMAQAVGRTQHRIVGPDHLFSFEDEPCPYCGTRVVATATAFHKAPDGWKCDEVDANCESEPDIDSPEWEDWFDGHSRDVYEILEPHSRRLVNRINREYRFALDRPNPTGQPPPRLGGGSVGPGCCVSESEKP